jgi:mono/diheme cytochrome c family protein
MACLALAATGLLATTSCIASGPGAAESSATESAALEAADAGEAPFPPPSTPVEPSPLTDQSSDLQAVLEWGTLSETDCDNYFAGQTDRTTTLRCGKWMFFYGNDNLPGAPKGLVDLIRHNAPRTAGLSLEKWGMIPDPTSPTGLAVGLVPGPEMPGGVQTYTVTCAGCHFGQTPDGRYVVGQPNDRFSFGKFALATSVLPFLAANPFEQLPPEAKPVLGPIRQELFGNPFNGNELAVIGQLIDLIPDLIVTQPTILNSDQMVKLAVLSDGTMDDFAPPVVDDGVPCSLRNAALYGIDPAAMTAAGSTHGAMLSSTGGQPDLEHVFRTIAYESGAIRKLPLGPAYDHDPATFEPLTQYVMSLKAPVNPNPPAPDAVAAGAQLFKQQCFGCHNGPGFAGTAVFDPAVIGTDPEIARILDPNRTGEAVDDLVTPPELTYGVRARRLPGIWSWTRLFHNGQVTTLEDVFCLNGPRPASPPYPGHSTAGHAYTCDGLTTDQKESLIAFLKSL